LYVDRHAIYRDEDHPDRPTQFGRAMKNLGVELIQAHSPQAKGRVERRNAVFQDRLVKEMRLRKINDMTGGNALLEGKFLAELNGKYAISPRREQDLHRSLEAGTVLQEVLCVQERRVVGQDWAQPVAADRQPACVAESRPRGFNNRQKQSQTPLATL
jgi:hypothetical protein